MHVARFENNSEKETSDTTYYLTCLVDNLWNLLKISEGNKFCISTKF